MYKYLDRPPQIGDVVQWIQNTDGTYFTKYKLYIVESLHTDEKENHPIVIRDNGTRDWAHTSNFKIVKTKLKTKLQVGDTVFCTDLKLDGTDWEIGCTYTISNINLNSDIQQAKASTSSWNSCDSFVVLCKATKQTKNPFKVGDIVRSISDDNPIDRPKGNIYTVKKIQDSDVYYKDRYATHYSKFELVSEKKPDTLIKVGSHWERSYTSESGKAGEIIQVTSVSPNMVKWCNNNCLVSHTYFFNNFHPRPDLDNPSTQETIQQSKPQEKEKPMTIQQLLQTLFGAEKPTTDYDKRPAILVVAYNRDGSQMGQAIADNIDDVKAKVADTPELWGCKVLTYTLDQEVSVDVPVKTAKAKVAKAKG